MIFGGQMDAQRPMRKSYLADSFVRQMEHSSAKLSEKTAAAVREDKAIGFVFTLESLRDS